MWPVSSRVFARARVFPSFDFEFWFDTYPRIRFKLAFFVISGIFGSGQSTDPETSRLILKPVDWLSHQSTGQWHFCFSFLLQTSRPVRLPVDWPVAFSFDLS